MDNEIQLPKKVAKFLTDSAIKCEAVGHRTVYTAFDKAATLRLKPAAIVKVLMLKADGDLVMALVGGDRNLDAAKLQKLIKAKKLDFAKEKAIGETFKGIDPGAIPPFEGLWGIRVFCDKKLLEQAKLVLSAGSYETSLKIAPGAFKKANPQMVAGIFSAAKPKPKKQPKPNAKAGRKREASPKKAAKKTTTKKTGRK